MTVRMTARHFELNAGIKNHVESRSEAFNRFFDHILDVHWVLEEEKHRCIAEASAMVHGTTLTGSGEGTDMRTAVDDAATRMETQLKKYKGKMKDKDPKAIHTVKAQAERLA